MKQSILNEVQHLIMNQRTEIKNDIKQENLELEDRIDMLEQQSGEVNVQINEMMEQLDIYQDNIDKIFEQTQAQTAQSMQDLTERVQTTIDGHTTNMGRVEREI